MERFVVPDYSDDGDPNRNYLSRLRIIQTPWFGVYLHRFDTPDPRPTLHDHPWNFVSLVLRGGYIEVTSYCSPDDTATVANHCERKRYRTGQVNRKRAEDIHTITYLRRTPTWTLMFVGKRRREWGYVEPDGTWTRFDLHSNAAEFDAAMARRRESA